MTSFFLIFIRFSRAIKSAWRESEFRGLLFMVCVILFAGTIVYHLIEKWSYLDSFFFSVTTLTTVGYGGDGLSPHTPLSKIFTIIYIFIGLGVMLTFLNAIARHAQKEPSVVRGLAKDGKKMFDDGKEILKNANFINKKTTEEPNE